MRLTLRTLLAYLDDLLDPAQAREIGKKVAESDSVGELVERIRQVTRRRRLTTPDADPNAKKVDPNTMAEYLDNVLTGEELAQFEKLCLEADVNLAEAAACHQILTLVQSEPAEVPPPARQRMYGVVKGREAIPFRKPPVAKPPGDDDWTKAPDEDDRGVPAGAGGGSRWLAAAVILLLLGGLAAVITLALSRDPSGRPSEGPTPLAARPVSPHLAISAGLPVSVTTWLAGRPTLPLGFFLSPVSDLSGELTPLSRPVVLGLGWFSSWSGTVAARPALPPSMSLGLGRDEATPLPPHMRFPPLVAPSTGAVELATYKKTVKDREGFLVHQAAATDWRLHRVEDRIKGNEMLVALPGFRSDLVTDTELSVELVGNLPELTFSPILEAAVQLHQNSLVDLDMTFHRGRVVVTSLKREQTARIRLRFYDGRAWDMVLPAGGKLALEMTGRLAKGTGGPWIPHVRMTLITVERGLFIRRGSTMEEAPAGRLLLWDNDPRLAPELSSVQFPAAAIPDWIESEDIPADNLPAEIRNFVLEVRAILGQFRKQVLDKLEGKRPDEHYAWITLGCLESLNGKVALQQRLALYAYAAIDQLLPIAEMLDDPARPNVRESARIALMHWLGRAPQQQQRFATLLELQLIQAKKTFADQELVLELLRGVDEPAQLVPLLNHPHLAVRDLAAFNLRQLVPAATAPPYDPAAPEEMRLKYLETWKARFLLP